MLLSHLSVAQNIVVNGGFEDLESCPQSPGRLYLATPWRSGQGSVDLMNVCGIGEWTIPTNRGGGQWPNNGSGYARFATFSSIFDNARELLWQPIRYKLVAGEQYYFEMYVSLCDSLAYATHNMGIVFEDTILDDQFLLECLFQCPPVVENTSANPLTSKTGWIKVSGTFTAEGGEKYIHIGNLRNDSASEIEHVGGGVGNEQYTWEESAYYIDDVWLSHVDSMHYVSVNEGLGMSNHGLEVWPNPTGEVFTVKSGKPHETLTLYDMTGRDVLESMERALQTVVDVSLLAEGVYVLKLEYDDGTTVSQRVVVQRP